MIADSSRDNPIKVMTDVGHELNALRHVVVSLITLKQLRHSSNFQTSFILKFSTKMSLKR